ncbi:hypothetical protein [Streptomyces sp. SID3343]|uniref:hypothetical protein n=1 Tax=Streptomyces sp. SID3343 TaxID=2690260 RepID=UPI00136B0E95|nr:hypothetical protein [Streptomyces sp. SID3343]MYW01287.1 hypothetical protein [Streptomyces sp. SID3343]
MSMNSVNADGHPTGGSAGEAPTLQQGVPPAAPPQPPYPKHAALGAPATQDRTRQFTADVGELKLRAPKTTLDTQLMWLGVGLMGLGIVMGVGAYFMSHNTTLYLTQNDAITLGLSAIPVSILGFALFLRYSLSTFMRFWLARLIAAQQIPQAAGRAEDATTVLPTIPAGH